MKIPSEIRAKVFALYSPENFILNKEEFPRRFNYVDVFECRINKSRHNVDYCSIIVTPIKLISDDDAIAVAKILKPNDDNVHNSEYGKIYIRELFKGTMQTAVKYFNLIDYLRSKHYAIPYLNYSVEDMVNDGLMTFKK